MGQLHGCSRLQVIQTLVSIRVSLGQYCSAFFLGGRHMTHSLYYMKPFRSLCAINSGQKWAHQPSLARVSCAARASCNVTPAPITVTLSLLDWRSTYSTKSRISQEHETQSVHFHALWVFKSTVLSNNALRLELPH